MRIPPLVLMLVGVNACAATQPCSDTSQLAPAREVIADLGRIVAPTGIQDSYKIEIGGIHQWLNVRGQDRDNPIILFVHGGPASPAMPTLWQFQRPLEEYFTIAHWDQRGAGKTYGEAAPERIAESIRLPRFVNDAIEVAEHVRKRYGERKLILIGHSWGSVVGMHAALERPDLFHAYVGIGQIIDARENERISYNYALARARANGNIPALEELQSIAPYPGDQPITRERIIIARKWAQHYGGLSAFRKESGYYFRGPRLSPEYSDEDRCAIDKGSLLTLERVLADLLAVDFTRVRSFPLPVIMFLGRHDYTTPSDPTAAWLEQVNAPFKQAVWFERSAHMAPWEEPGKTLVSLLRYVRPLATKEPAESMD